MLVSSVTAQFVFNKTTADFREAIIQGEVTYRVDAPEKLAAMINYSVDGRGRYQSDDPTKVNDRMTRAAQIAAREFAQRTALKKRRPIPEVW